MNLLSRSRASLLLSLFACGCASTVKTEPAADPTVVQAPVPQGSSGSTASTAAAPAPSAPASAPTASQPPALKAPDTFDLKAIDEYMTRQTKERGFIGLSLAIVQDGAVVLARGYGKSSLAAGTDVDPDTAFAVGSITKQFTCASALLLADDGKLSMQDKVSKYYPDLTRARDITLLDLGAHVAGYPDYYPLDFLDRRMQKPTSLDQLLKDYAGQKLDFEPGARFSYSNTGYILLGRVVEKASGEPFGAFLARRVLKPLGMSRSMFEPKPGEKGLAVGYTSFALGDPEVARREDEGWLHAAGGLYATASVGSSRVDLQACKLEYSIVSPK